MRVLYVAMTRAREHLILVGSCDADAPQTWTEQWGRHVGPLPDQRVLGARTMLDWIGPAAAAIEGSGTKDRIELTWHEEAELTDWTTATARRAELTDEQQRLARLEPLSPPPPAHPDAARITQRLTARYPFEAFTKVQASQSVGSLTKEGRFAPAGESPSRQPIVEFGHELELPRCVQTDATASPTERGTATHLVLEHLDFARPCDQNDLAQQVADLVRKHLLAPELAKVVDLDAILWLMSTDLGKTLRRNTGSLHRELPVYYPLACPGIPAGDDPSDRIMVRGRLDLLIEDHDGMIIIDFKTDRLTPETLDARADFYRPQLLAYSDAITNITGRRVKSALLVFLTPRVILSTSLKTGRES
jgi:ATP-dependent helicase/nuclease subunit A